MLFRRLFPTLLVGLALGFALSSCSKGSHANGRSAPGQTYRSDIQLGDILEDQGCLSVPKLYESLRAADPGRPAVSVPVSIAFDSVNAIRDDFRRVIAYGQLVIAHVTLADLQALPKVSQDGCTAMTVTGSDGVDKTFTVKKSARDAIMAEADDGERIDYSWLSPTSILSRHRYAVLDQPCTTNDKPVLVTVGKVIDWSDGGVAAAVPATGASVSIDPDFLALAAAAVGDSPDSVFDTAPDGSKLLNLGKVSAMTAKLPRPEVLSCGGTAVPDPTPPHDPISPGNDNPDPNGHP